MNHSTSKLALILTLGAVTWGLTSCSKDKDVSKPKLSSESLFGISGKILSEAERARTLRVTDMDGKVVAQAQVLVGDAINSPFAANFLMTDAEGNFKAPEAWTAPMVVTISAPGFVRVSFFGQTPQGQSFQLRRAASQAKFELKGQGLGFQVKDKDGISDFALVIPTMRKQDLFAFDLGMFISPLNDDIEIFGKKLSVPSNVMLPKQKENYGIIPITLEKPQYRMYFQTAGPKRIFTARGTFPFKEVVGELQGNKSFIDLINYFALKSGSLKEVSITQPTQNMDLPVNELIFNQTKNFKAPIIAADEFLLAVPLSTYQGELMPTDIKNVASNTALKLTVAPGGNNQVLVVVKKKAEQDNLSGGRLTAAIVPFEDNAQPQLLPLLENPQVLSLSELRVTRPALPSNILAAATYSVLSSVETKNENGVMVESASRLWEVYAGEWQAQIKLPVWPNDSVVAGKKRWEVTLTGSQVNKDIDLGPRLLENVTHATHGSSDF